MALAEQPTQSGEKRALGRRMLLRFGAVSAVEHLGDAGMIRDRAVQTATRDNARCDARIIELLILQEGGHKVLV